MERCSDARPYWCEACDKGFRYLNTYNRHLNRYHPARHEAVSGSDYDPTQDDMDISADSGTSDEEHTELYGSMDTCSNTADDGVRANAFENHSERTRSPIALRARLANIQHNCQESDTDDGDESNTAEEDEMQCDPLPPPEPEDGDSFDQHQDGTAMRPRQMLESRLLDFLEPQPLHFEQPTIALDIEGFLHDAKFASINEIIGPFKSVRDVNMAHMALAVLDLGEKQVDDLMRGIADDSTIGSAKRHGWSTMAELKTLIRQSHFHDPFTLTDVHIIHSTSTFPHRRIIPTIERLFKSTKFLLKFTTTPRGVRYGDEPVYLDPAAGIAWQAHHDDLMKQVGPFDEEGVPNMLLPIGFYSDKSNISANQDAHPLFVFLAGVHPDILSKPSYRAMRLLAMFPIPTDAALQGLSVSKMSEARRTVYHDCMKIVLDDEWLHAMEHGKRMTGPDGCKYNVFPFLLQYQADLQEFAMITQTRGHRGMCPCPKCLIPAELVTSPDLDDHRTAPRRSQSDMIQLLEANITKAKCKELGAWKAPSALFAATSDVYECAAVDPLHQFDLGVVPYVTQAVQQLIDATEADTKGKLEELRLRTSTWMPPYHALEARTVSLLAIDPKMQKSLKAHEWRSVTRILLPCTADLPGVELVKAMCDFDLFARASAPTPWILALSDKALESLFSAWYDMQDTLKLADEQHKVPEPLKFHMLTHYNEAATWYGAVNAQGAQRGEKEHSVTTKTSAEHTNYNRATVSRQMCDWVALVDALNDMLETLQLLHGDSLGEYQNKRFAHITDLFKERDNQPTPAAYCFGSHAITTSTCDPCPTGLHPYTQRLVAQQLSDAPLPHYHRAWPSATIWAYQSIKLSFWSNVIHTEVTQLLRARLPGNKKGAWCDGVVYLKDGGQKLGIGRIRHCIKFATKPSVGQAAVVGCGVILEPMSISTLRDPTTGQVCVEEPAPGSVILAPPESLLFGVHLCPNFSSMTPAGHAALRTRRESAKSFTGVSPWFTQYFVNHNAEEHVGLMFAQDEFLACFCD